MNELSDDDVKPWEWKSGGGPTHSRSTLGEAFLADLVESWAAQGRKAIADVIHKKPDVYLRIVASVGLKPMNEKTDALDDFDDEELAALIVAARGALKASERSGGAGDEES